MNTTFITRSLLTVICGVSVICALLVWRTHEEKPILYTDSGTRIDWSLTASDVNYFFDEIHIKYKCKGTVPYTAFSGDLTTTIMSNIHHAIECMKKNEK